ncbi:hypothetical protein GCM10010885_22700 [Alicyclobacillus cellulosilyticus]|uniref:EAL domain-containing protein n=1 Tax=Alicyclobacillus cellulosilyticus TaxID=1003997 RepID=A0A917KG20_9BACL|nr:EAL domain-containing protein [Alicyclobacillus cellulosilyticus]GGJ12861.1 hypothetical protein GCM10010885_22700 [Alicyclobacillus cellulosilyticus]
MRRGALHIVYQPIVDHAATALFGWEALARPVLHGTTLRPDVWFRAAHQCGSAARADALSLILAVTHLSAFPREVRAKPLFVNVLPSSLTDEAYVQVLETVARQLTGGLSEQLVVEIVEYVDYDPAALREAVRRLRALGVRIALDDVGTDHASLKAFTLLRPEFVKLDRSLIQGLSAAPARRQGLAEWVRQVQAVSVVIAEGVETRQDLTAVRETGITLSQGYYWSPPVAPDGRAYIAVEIEIKRHALFETVRRRAGCLTHPDVIRTSQELDSLILRYYRG